MAYNLVTLLILEVDVIIDNYCLLIRRLKLKLPLKTLANWPRSLDLDTIPLPS